MMLGEIASLDTIVATGFGIGRVTCDGETLIEGERPWSCAFIRGVGDRWSWRRQQVSYRMARQSPNGLIRLSRVERYLAHRERSGAPVTGKLELQLVGPFSSATWERRALGEWVLTFIGDGIA